MRQRLKKQVDDKMTGLIVSTAKQLLEAHPGLRPGSAVRMVQQLMEEVNAHILRQCTPEEWETLSAEDRTHVCTELIMALLDQKKRDAFLLGETKRLVV